MTGQPVQDGDRTARERRFDGDLARADRINDYSDRDTCRAVEDLARKLARPEEVSHGLVSSSPEVVGPRDARAADNEETAA